MSFHRPDFLRVQTLFKLVSFHWRREGWEFICFILPACQTLCETCLLPGRGQDIPFISLPLSFSHFPSRCQAVTAAERARGGMDSAVSVAHKSHLIGAWLLDRRPAVSQRHWEQVCTRIRWTVAATDPNRIAAYTSCTTFLAQTRVCNRSH